MHRRAIPIVPPIPQYPPPGVEQHIVDQFRRMHLDGTLVAYCDHVLPELVDRMCQLLERREAA